MEYTPFWRQNKILIQDDLVVFTDSQNNASESNLIAVQLEGFHENYKWAHYFYLCLNKSTVYRTADEQFAEENSLQNLFSWGGGWDNRFYLKEFEERPILLSFARPCISQLVITEDYIYWTEERQTQHQRWSILTLLLLVFVFVMKVIA